MGEGGSTGVRRLLVLVDLAVGVVAAVVTTNLVRARLRMAPGTTSSPAYEDPTIVRITFIVCLIVITPFVTYRVNRARARRRARRAEPAATAGSDVSD